MTQVAVVIPAHDEAATIGAVVAAVLDAVPEANVIVIDDASADATSSEAAAAGARAVRSDRRRGYAGALRLGYQAAIEAGAGAVAQVDGDGQHECADLPQLIEALSDADLVIGSRFLDGGGRYRPPLLRRCGMAGCRWLAQRAGGPLTDPTSGFRALRGELAATLAEEGFPRGLTEVSLLIRLRRRGLRISEVPVRMYPSTGPSMHDGLAGGAHALRIGWDVAGLFARPGAH